LNAISDVFCVGRKTPLLVGSVKSNMGHAEPVSGLVSIAKVLYALETGIIPANINFETLNHNIPKLVSGELKVIYYILFFIIKSHRNRMRSFCLTSVQHGKCYVHNNTF